MCRIYYLASLSVVCEEECKASLIRRVERQFRFVDRDEVSFLRII